MPCVFCGHPHVTRGHVLPEWMARESISARPGRLVQVHHDRTTTDKPGALFKDNVRRVCQKECNGGWMSRMEDAAKPALRYLIRGVPAALSPADVEAVAKWCYLVALMASMLRPEMPIPRERFAWFYKHQEPPAGASIYLATHPWRSSRHAASYLRRSFEVEWGGVHRMSGPKETVVPDNPNVFYTTVTAYSLVLQVVDVVLPDLSGTLKLTRPDFLKSDALYIIWPNSSAIDWPPPRPLDHLGVRALASSKDKFDVYS